MQCALAVLKSGGYEAGDRIIVRVYLGSSLDIGHSVLPATQSISISLLGAETLG
jgi:hypothetical protein